MKKHLLTLFLFSYFASFSQQMNGLYQANFNKINDQLLISKSHNNQLNEKQFNTCEPFNNGTKHHLTSSSRTLVPIWDSLHYWNIDVNHVDWILKGRSIDFIYDSNNRLISSTRQSTDGLTWANSYKLTYTYDENGNTINQTVIMWTGNSFENNSKVNWTYDLNNNLISETNQNWTNSTWTNTGFRTINTYDANNNNTISLQQNWDGSNWVDASQTLYSYNASNENNTTVVQTYNGTAWENYYQLNNSFDSNHNLIYQETQFWSGSDWSPVSNRVSSTYDANNNLIYYHGETGGPDNWVDLDEGNLYYDLNNDLINNYVKYNWDGSNWGNYNQLCNSYDQNFIQLAHSFKWGSASQWDGGDSTRYYFHTVDDVGFSNKIEDQEPFGVFPNPSNGIYKLWSKNQMNSIEIFSLRGERAYMNNNVKNTSSVEVDLTAYSDGIYLVKIEIDNTVHCIKISKN